MPSVHRAHPFSTMQAHRRQQYLQVFQADLQVQLARARDDVLARLLDGALHHGVGLGQPFQPCASPQSRHHRQDISFRVTSRVAQR